MAGELGNIGTAHVTVELDFTRAHEEARKAGATIPPVEVRVDLDQSQVTREFKTTMEQAKVSAGPVEPRVDFDKEKIKEQMRVAFANPPEIQAKVDLDKGKIAAQIRSTLQGAARAAGGIPVHINPASLAAMNAQLRGSLAKSFALAGSAARLAFIPGLLGLGAFAYELKKGQEAADEFSVSMANVEQAVGSAGKASGVTTALVKDTAGGIKEATGISGNAIRAGIASLVRFRAVTKASLPDTAVLLTDISVAMGKVDSSGGDLTSTAAKLARVLKDPTKAGKIFARAGFTLTKQQDELVKSLVKTGKTAQANQLVFKLLGETFGGAAARFGETTKGQLARARLAFEDARKDLALRILPAIAPAVRLMSNDIAKALESNGPAIAEFAKGLIRGGSAVTQFVLHNKTFHAVLAAIGSTISGVKNGLQGFGQSFSAAFNKNSGQSAKTFGETIRDLGKFLGEVAEKWLPRLGTAVGTAAGFFAKHQTTFKIFFGLFVVTKIVGVTTALGFLGPALASVARVIVLTVIPALTALATSAIPVLIGILAGPVGVVALILGLAAAFELAYVKSEKFRRGVKLVGTGLSAIVPGLGTIVPGLAQIGDAFVKNGNKAKESVPKIQSAMGSISLATSNLAADSVRSQTTFSGLLGTVEKLIGKAAEGARRHATALAQQAGKALKAVGDGIKRALVLNTIDQARKALVSFSAQMRRFMGNALGMVNILRAVRVELVLTSASIRLSAAAFRILNAAMAATVRFAQTRLVGAFANSVTRIRTILSAVNLSGQGSRIMGTLLSGLRDGFEKVQTFIRGIASWIRANKGPISTDKKLLYPAGQAIMGGFDKGLQTRWSPVRSWVKEIGTYFKGAVGSDLFNKPIANILLGGGGGVAGLNSVLAKDLGIPAEYLKNGPLGFLHPTSGWADTLSQGRLLERIFGLQMGSGLRQYDTVAGPGVSQHVLGEAIDWGTGANSYAQLDHLARFASKLTRVFKQVIWQNRDWTNGGFIPDHLDHVHTGWQRRAAGGNTRKGEAYSWNERGREMFVPQQSGYVMNAGRTKELISAIRSISQKPATQNSRNAEIHVHSNAADPAAVGGIVMTHLGGVFSRA